MTQNKEKNLTGATLELQPRKRPAQKRAEVTINHILDTTAQLIEEVGLEGFNTNLLAKRADLKVGTIYRYFPNKFAILNALLQRWADLVLEAVAIFKNLADPAKDWRKIISSVVVTYSVGARKQPNFIAIRRAMQAAPELRSIEKKLVDDLSKVIVEGLKVRRGDFSERHLFNAATTIVVAAQAVIDFAWLRSKNDPIPDAVILEELTVMATSYFANYLD